MSSKLELFSFVFVLTREIDRIDRERKKRETEINHQIVEFVEMKKKKKKERIVIEILGKDFRILIV